jgi:hypothetical protein
MTQGEWILTTRNDEYHWAEETLDWEDAILEGEDTNKLESEVQWRRGDIVGGQGCLGIPGLTVMELDALTQLEAPGICIYLLPALGGGGGDDALVVSRLPSQRIYHVVLAGRGGDAALGGEGVQGDRLLIHCQGNAVLS